MANKKNTDSAETPGRNNPDDVVKKPASKRAAPKADKPAQRKTRAKSKADVAEEKVEAVARKAKSTAKKLAGAVSGKVKDISEKAGAKSSTSRTRKTTGGAAKSTRATTGTKQTKVGALTAKVSSKDIRESLADMPDSQSIPEEDNIHAESATDVKQHYFHDQHVHEGPPPPQPSRDVPDEYGDTKLVLLVRDPEWVYAYWEINDDTRKALNIPRNGNAKRHVLRLFKVSGRRWPEEAAHYFFDVDIPDDARSWYVHMPEPNELWCAELGVIDNNDAFVVICRSNEIYMPRNTISDQVDSEWMTVEESFEKITRLSGANLEERLRGEGHTASESILRHIHRQLTGVIPGERVELSSGIFSSEAAARHKDFWLQLHTELILYGATEPDAKVTVQGRNVTLNDDGTFSMRFALPDGQQVLEVRARNADEDKEETITPVVERTTR